MKSTSFSLGRRLPITVATVWLFAAGSVSFVAAAEQPKLEKIDTLIRGGTVVTMNADRRVIERGAVAVREGRIVAVGTVDELAGKYEAPQVIEAEGRLVIPGLINTHGHAAMSL